MSDNQQLNQQPDSPGMVFDAQPVAKETPADAGMTFDSAPVQRDGEIVNDVGNEVIVPKDGETFADTMKRAAEYGKTVTPDQIHAEMQTAPKKAAEVLAAAPVIGAAGAATLGEVGAGVRAIPGITEALLQHAETKAAEWAAQYPNLIGVAKALGIPATTAGVLGWLYHNSKGK